MEDLFQKLNLNTKLVSISHIRIDVKDWDVGFLVFSGHKMFAPMGIGGVYI